MTESKNRLRPRFALTAGTLTQLLAGFACFLASFVLPNTFPEFQGMSTTLLVVLGCIMLGLGILNLLFGQAFGRVLSRAGKRSRVVVPREGVGFLAIMLTLAVGALMGHRNMPLLVFGMMAGPFVLNGAIVYRMLQGITIVRRSPRTAVVGEFVAVEIEVVNGKKRMPSHMLEVRDRISGRRLKTRRRDDEGMVTFVRVPARESRVGRYQLRFTARGQYKLGPVRVSSRFPMGIGERGQLFSTTDELIVRPNLGQLLPAWSRQQKELSESSDHRQSRPGLFDDEFQRIREYRAGDNPRSIHWRSSARRGELMVREHHQNRHSDSLVLLDLPEIESWTSEESEMAISLAATICAEQTRSSSGSHYVLAIATKQPVLIASRSPTGFREEALDALAVCERSRRASLEDIIAAVVSGYNLGEERMILITPRPKDAEAALGEASSLYLNNSLNLLAQTTIVTATNSGLLRVFKPENLKDHRNSPARNRNSSGTQTATSPEVTGGAK